MSYSSTESPLEERKSRQWRKTGCLHPGLHSCVASLACLHFHGATGMHTLLMAKQFWNQVRCGKVTLGNVGRDVHHTDGAGLRMLLARTPLLSTSSESEKSYSWNIYIQIVTGTVRNSTRTWLDKNCKSTETNHRAQAPLNYRSVDSPWVWLEMSTRACSSSCLAFFLFQPPFIPSQEGSKLQCFSNTFQIYIIL